MPVQIHIPTPVRAYVNQQDTVTVDTVPATVGALLDDVLNTYPGLRKHLVADDGQFRKYVNYYRNDEDIRCVSGMDTALKSGDIVSIIPAIAGGGR
jgi:molybdopterin synthase sulfur carrier subunit